MLAAGVFPLATEREGIHVTIRGAGRELSILDGGGTTGLLLFDSTLTLRALTVRNAEDGVHLSDSSAVIEDVRFDACTRDGLELNRRSSAIATDVEFVNMGDDGIDMGRNASLLCTDCLIADNEDDGIEIRLNDFTGPPVTIEVRQSRIERNGGVGIQLIDYEEPNPRTFHFHDVLIAENVDGGVTWQCCGDSGEDLDGWPGDEPVLIERATIVGNGGPGVEGGAPGLMEVRDSIVFEQRLRSLPGRRPARREPHRRRSALRRRPSALAREPRRRSRGRRRRPRRLPDAPVLERRRRRRRRPRRSRRHRLPRPRRRSGVGRVRRRGLRPRARARAPVRGAQLAAGAAPCLKDRIRRS